MRSNGVVDTARKAAGAKQHVAAVARGSSSCYLTRTGTVDTRYLWSGLTQFSCFSCYSAICYSFIARRLSVGTSSFALSSFD